MHRRGFIALSAASAAASTVSGMPTLTRVTGQPHLAKPELIEFRQHDQDPTRAIPVHTSPLTFSTTPISNPTIELAPLACTESRVADNAGVDIELRHPGCGIDSILYSAHNTGPGAFPAGVVSQAQTDQTGALMLIVTQRPDGNRQQHRIRIDATRSGSYLLAIPTQPGARTPVWRTSTIEINESQTPIRVRSLFESRARSCMLMSVRVLGTTNMNQGAHHAC